MAAPLPWERLLWSGHPAFSTGERYALTDFRVVCERPDEDEMPLQDVGDVVRTQSAIERLLRASTLTIHARPRPRRPPRAPIVFRRIRDGAHLAALIELLAGDPQARLDHDTVAAALAWRPTRRSGGVPEALAAITAIAIAIAGIVFGLHGAGRSVVYAADDPIYPGGVKRDRGAIVAFMKSDVMPWARTALAPIVRTVSCETCHGRDADARGWRMPGVAALPLPGVKDGGWELWNGTMDAQMRNAIYGYGADSDKQRKAAYMREVVMPGMARLLHRPAYDFSRTYGQNRDAAAFGCYHCHKVK